MEEPTINDLVAEEIRVLLARRRLSASDLARMTGMTQRAISRRLTGEKVIDVEDLAAISRVLDVEVTDLLPRPAEGRVVKTVGQGSEGRPNVRLGRSSVRRKKRKATRKARPIGGPRDGSAAPASAVPPTQRRPALVSGPVRRMAA